MIEIATTSDTCTSRRTAIGCFGLGMMFSAGAGTDIDLVQAHKWFNIAAMRGHRDAAALRREIAELMSDSEIGCAQRAARDWLKAHPQAAAPAPRHSPPERVLPGPARAKSAGGRG